MSIVDEYSKLKEAWADSTLTAKLIIAVFAILTITPLASLAETLIAWKGFLRDGINFYRDFVTEPLIELFKTLGLFYTQVEIDTLFALGWQYFGAIRVAIFQFPRGWRKYAFVMVNAISWSGFAAIYGLSAEEVGVLEFIAFVALFLWYGRYLAKDYGVGTLVIYYAPAFFSVFVILILGAVNVAFVD